MGATPQYAIIDPETGKVDRRIFMDQAIYDEEMEQIFSETGQTEEIQKKLTFRLNDHVKSIPDKTLLDLEELPATPQPRRLRQLHFPAYFFGARVVRRLRPFARRRLMTLRPPGVRCRLRNPCTRFLRFFFG